MNGSEVDDPQARWGQPYCPQRLHRRRDDRGGPAAVDRRHLGNRRGCHRAHKLVPWSIASFLALAALRQPSAQATLARAATVANLLTVVSMTALVLGTGLKVIAKAGGGRITTAVTLNLLLLGGISLLLTQIRRSTRGSTLSDELPASAVRERE